MLSSFFPNPRWFFLSALLWSAICISVWYGYGPNLAAALGFVLPAEASAPVIGLGFFVTSDFVWFYLYYWIAGIIILFAVALVVLSPVGELVCLGHCIYFVSYLFFCANFSGIKPLA
jgi:ABC-type long-subunit fatty acid transport system fused permease/ATPase subunit